MNLLLTIVFFLFSQLTLASNAVSQKLPNNHLAYYGEQFYKNFPQNITKESLHEILDNSHTTRTNTYDQIGDCSKNCYDQVSLGYSEARKVLFGKIYLNQDAKGTFINDVYCHKKFYFRDINEALRMHDEVNTEHTWPQSRFSTQFPKDIQKSDMHHLFLTDSEANSRRGNYSFGEVSENDDILDVDDCDESRLSRNGDVRFAPPVEHRGNVARALFYFATRYNLQIDASQEKTLRQWHKQDPIDEKERVRHEAISQYQNVRNPFIDYPQLVDSISNF